MTLDEIRVGQRVTVVDVQGTSDVSLRLMEMGLTPGVQVTCLGAAPLGDPLELELRGYRLSLRRSEAALVRIDRLP
jgi:ferrous iron transport protein A